MNNLPVSNILFVNSVSGIGGAELSLFELATHLERSRFSPHVLTTVEGQLADKMREAGIPVYFGDFPFFSRRRPWRYWTSVWAMVRLIRRCQIRLLHVNCDRAVPHSVWASKVVRIPCVCHIRDLQRAWFRPAYVRHLNRADRIIANSHATAHSCLAAGMKSDKIVVVYSCFEFDRYASVDSVSRDRFRREFNLSEHAVAIGLVGQVTENKGHREFVEAAKIVASRCPEARFFVIGDDSLSIGKNFLAELRQNVTASGLDERVFFVGYRSDVPDVMAGLDIVAVPSWQESFGRVVVEALASRRPVVASNTGGIPEIVQDGVTGFLVPPKDCEQLAERLLRLCTDRNLRVTMGLKGPAAAERFDVRNHVNYVQALYLDLLCKRGSHPRITDCR